MKQFTSKKQKIGEIGENATSKFLKKSGYTIMERNYTKKCGEIDIIAKKGNFLHFFEVKTVSCEIGNDNVIHETSIKPYENMHYLKIKRILNTVQLYLHEKKVHEKIQWQLDLSCVYLDFKKGKARIELTKNIIVS